MRFPNGFLIIACYETHPIKAISIISEINLCVMLCGIISYLICIASWVMFNIKSLKGDTQMLGSFKIWSDEIIKHIIMPYTIIPPAIHVKRNKHKLADYFSRSAFEVSILLTFFFFYRTCNDPSLLWHFLAFNCLPSICGFANPPLRLILGSARLMSRARKQMTSCVPNDFVKNHFIFPLWSDGVGGEWLVLIWLCWLTETETKIRGLVGRQRKVSLPENSDVFHVPCWNWKCKKIQILFSFSSVRPRQVGSLTC